MLMGKTGGVEIVQLVMGTVEELPAHKNSDKPHGNWLQRGWDGRPGC